MVQTIRMQVQVYSGIAPPQELLNAMANNIPTAPSQTPFSQQKPSYPQQAPPQFGPASLDVPNEAPPSYEDAIADDLGPVDGPRRDYAQPQQQHTPTGSGEKGGWGERLFPESGR